MRDRHRFYRQNEAEMLIKRSPCLFFLLLAAPLFGAPDETDPPPTEPEMISIFPSGGRQGTSFEAGLRGRALGGAYALWFDAQGLEGQVQGVENVELVVPQQASEKAGPGKTRPGQRVLLHIRIDPTVKTGSYSLRVVTPKGVSNAAPFLVVSDPVVNEKETSHSVPGEAQRVSSPLVINGRIATPRELDYYEFEVSQGQELAFEVFATGKHIFYHEETEKEIVFQSQLSLYQPAGSWLNPDQPAQLRFREELTSEHWNETRWTYRFDQGGRYLVRVGSVYGKASPDFVYQLRMVGADRPPIYEEASQLRAERKWKERTFSRKLEVDRLQTLWSRSVKVPKEETSSDDGDVSTSPSSSPGRLREENSDSSWTTTEIPFIREEPTSNERLDQAQKVPYPVLIEGAIESLGDQDLFRIKVNSGDRLAFEIETLDTKPPHFNPRLEILDSQGNEFLTNRHQRIAIDLQDPLTYLGVLKLHLPGGSGCDLHSITYLERLEPKTTATFPQDGEYTVRIRDLTSRNGGATFRYRFMIRPQVPHLGDLEVQEDRVNLPAGEGKKLTVTTGREEGFRGETAFSVEGLPAGVQAFSGGQVEQKGPLGNPSLGEENFLPETQKSTILLVADADAPATKMPELIRVSARPLVAGKPGRALLIAEVPLMVVRDGEVHGNVP